MVICTKQEPVKATAERLRRFVDRMEHRYEYFSDFMVTAVANGHMKETVEVARWLTSYRASQWLVARGQEIGTSTPTIR
jgi:hypothetical protein